MNNTVQLLASLLDTDRRWAARELAAEVSSMSQNCVPHSARHSGLPQNCSMLDTPWNFRGTTMGPLYSHTGLVGPVPKGKWRHSWTNHRYGRNLCSLIRTKQETPNKRMKESRLSSSKESSPYTKYCKGDDYGVWHWLNKLHHAVPPRHMVNAATAASSYSTTYVQRLGENVTWRYRTPSFFMTMKGITPLLLSLFLASLAMGDCETSTVLTRYESKRLRSLRQRSSILLFNNGHVLQLWSESSSKWRNHCEGPGTTQEMNLPVLKGGQYRTREMDALMAYDAFQTFGWRW